jgi:hypothetical protein
MSVSTYGIALVVCANLVRVTGVESVDRFVMVIDMVSHLVTGLEIHGVVWTGAVEVGDRLEVREGERLVGYAEVDSVMTGARRVAGGEPVLWLRIDGVDQVAVGMVVTCVSRGGLELPPLGPDRQAGLTFTDSKRLLRFHGAWHWAYAKTFHIDPDLDDRALLAGLLAHPEYRDDYVSERLTDDPVHGPYNLIRITPKAFDALSNDAATAAFRTWVDQAAEGADEVEGDIDAVEAVISASDTVYQLKDLGSRAMHHFGWILYDFLELVLIQRTTRQLHLVVGAGD